MQENANTDTENVVVTVNLDPEDWQIAFEPYEGEPQAALTLGFRLTELKQSITDLKMLEAIEEIDVAIDCLYEHSDFRTISRALFGTAIAGKLSTEREALLRKLGIEI
jgi:hypothetical protein